MERASRPTQPVGPSALLLPRPWTRPPPLLKPPDPTACRVPPRALSHSAPSPGSRTPCQEVGGEGSRAGRSGPGTAFGCRLQDRVTPCNSLFPHPSASPFPVRTKPEGTLTADRYCVSVLGNQEVFQGWEAAALLPHIPSVAPGLAGAGSACAPTPSAKGLRPHPLPLGIRDDPSVSGSFVVRSFSS